MSTEAVEVHNKNFVARPAPAERRSSCACYGLEAKLHLAALISTDAFSCTFIGFSQAAAASSGGIARNYTSFYTK